MRKISIHYKAIYRLQEVNGFLLLLIPKSEVNFNLIESIGIKMEEQLDLSNVFIDFLIKWD